MERTSVNKQYNIIIYWRQYLLIRLFILYFSTIYVYAFENGQKCSYIFYNTKLLKKCLKNTLFI